MIPVAIYTRLVEVKAMLMISRVLIFTGGEEEKKRLKKLSKEEEVEVGIENLGAFLSY